MSASRDDEFGFAPDYDSPVPYMQRTRDYYTAIGYTTPYRWAHYVEAPFPPLKKPLAAIARRRIVTTAAPYQPDKGDQGPGAAYNGGAKFYQVYSGDTVAATTTCASRTSATTASTPPPRTAAPGSRCRSCARLARGPHRRGRAALPWRADQPQPSRHDRDRRAGDPGALPRGRRRCRRAWCRTARSATRPPAWSRGIWRRTASRPW